MPTKIQFLPKSSLPQKRPYSQFAIPLKGAPHRLATARHHYSINVMACADQPWSLILVIILLLHAITSSSKPDSEILLKFKYSLGKNSRLSTWNTSTSPCSGDGTNWIGILCEKGTIWGLQLENMGLTGAMDLNSLKELPFLRTLSFMHNNFEGPLPSIKELRALKSVYLTNNKFSGEIQANAFDGMLSLKKVHLAHNRFTGLIPLSLTILPRLLELRLEGNKFEGAIPDFQQDGLKVMNVSNNVLEGQIPEGLSKMDASSFSGNSDLCGPPLGLCPSSQKLSVGTIVLLVIVVAAALAAIAAVFVILRRGKPTPQLQEAPGSLHVHKEVTFTNVDKMEQGSPREHSSKGRRAELTFLRDDRQKFDLPDLLKASAEILGSGCFGSSYKASVITGAPMMVVKRFRYMNNVSREEFQDHVRRLAKLRHPNLLPLVAFYYRKEEKLLVSDYVDNVSLAVYLHGNHSRGQPSLDWQSRLKIIKGVSKGLLYLYNELPNLIAPHGHLKSSNVLLNESLEPLLTDYGLAPVVNQENAQDFLVAYKSPEYKQHNRIMKKTDVWSFGILILEILTGKFPANFLQQGKGSDTDSATWLHSIVREEWTMEIFDKEMGMTKNSEGEMMKLLKIGLSCCETDVEKRCDLKEAVERMQEVKEKDGDEQFYSSHASEGELRSSRGLSDDFSCPNQC